MKNYLLSASDVLPISGQPLKNCSVAVRGERIIDVGHSVELEKKYKKFIRIDLGQGILLPGFINCHTHLELDWTRTRIGKFSGFTEWLERLLKAKSDPHDSKVLEDSVRKGVKELLNCGVSTVGEVSSYNDQDIEILREYGIRVILFRELLDSNRNTVKTDDFGTSNSLLEIRPFPHSPYSCSPELISSVIDISADTGVPFAIHLAESEQEVRFVRNEGNEFETRIYKLLGKKKFNRHTSISPLKYMLDGFNLTGNTRMTAVHMVQVTKDEIDKLIESDTGVVVCPRSNIYLSVGEPPLDLYRDMERIGIGTDGSSSNYNLDFFEELRCLNSIAAGTMGEFSSRFTVYASTLGGARSLFIEDKTGSIEKGKYADLLFIRTDKDTRNPYESVVNSTRNCIGFFMINGKIITKQ